MGRFPVQRAQEKIEGAKNQKIAVQHLYVPHGCNGDQWAKQSWDMVHLKVNQFKMKYVNFPTDPNQVAFI